MPVSGVSLIAGSMPKEDNSRLANQRCQDRQVRSIPPSPHTKPVFIGRASYGIHHSPDDSRIGGVPVDQNSLGLGSSLQVHLGNFDVRLVCSYRTCTVISPLASLIEIMRCDDVDPDLEVSATTHNLPDSPENTNTRAHGSSTDRKSRIALACKRCKRRKQRVSLEFRSLINPQNNEPTDL